MLKFYLIKLLLILVLKNSFDKFIINWDRRDFTAGQMDSFNWTLFSANLASLLVSIAIVFLAVKYLIKDKVL